MTTTSNLANAEADAFLRRRRRKNALMIAVSVVCMVVAAYLFFQQATVDPYDYGPGPIAFADSLQSNAELTADEIASLPLTGAAGQPLDLKQYRGDKNVVLVFTRGWTGGPPAGAEKYYVGNVCLYCATQTARMAANYSQF